MSQEHKSAKPQRMSKKNIARTLLIETAWEVCNQVGGIHTVIQSKVKEMVGKWGDQYCLIGPYVHPSVTAIFDPIEQANDPFFKAVKTMREWGYEAHYGIWLTNGSPKTVLLNPNSVMGKLGEIKYELWNSFGIPSPADDPLVNQVLAFGHMIHVFFEAICQQGVTDKQIIAHFHEWMAASCLPTIRKRNLPLATIFTTHATMLGRYLAMNDPLFYEYMPFYDWEKEAKHFNIECQVKIERAAAHGSHVFTTVSDVTGKECTYLLGRTPDTILPNGLNIERFVALHEFQNLHLQYKEKIHDFVQGHFFQSFPFDLDKTLYFFTSGRYEFRNKGFDLTLEALARLNYRMQQANMDTTVVMFFITKRPFTTIHPQVLQSKAVMDEIQETCKAIQKQVGEKLFMATAMSKGDHKLPDLNKFVDDFLKLRLRRTLQSWKSQQLPLVVTHNLIDDAGDEILNTVRTMKLVNNAHDRVKIVYHPDFVSLVNPLFGGIDYSQFVRGCHLGIFPSLYEPWGYTPLECIASGVPTVTSDLSGFGEYVLNTMKDHKERGIFVVNRKHGSYEKSAQQLADALFQFVKQNRRDRIAQRNRTESASVLFDWSVLGLHYENAYNTALQRLA